MAEIIQFPHERLGIPEEADPDLERALTEAIYAQIIADALDNGPVLIASYNEEGVMRVSTNGSIDDIAHLAAGTSMYLSQLISDTVDLADLENATEGADNDA